MGSARSPKMEVAAARHSGVDEAVAPVLLWPWEGDDGARYVSPEAMEVTASARVSWNGDATRTKAR